MKTKEERIFELYKILIQSYDRPIDFRYSDGEYFAKKAAELEQVFYKTICGQEQCF